MRRLFALLPLLVLVALAILFFGHGLNRSAEVVPAAMVGKPMPDMTLPLLDGGEASLAQSIEAARGGKSQPVLVNFHASWCVPCIAEAPELMTLKAAGVKIIGVAWKDEPEDTRSFLARYGDPFAARLVDHDNRLGTEFGVTGPPETYLIGTDGRILEKRAGAVHADEMLTLLAKAGFNP